MIRADCLEWTSSPQPVRSKFGGGVEGVRDPAEVVGEQVTVTVERERRRLVAKEALEHLDVGSSRDCQARACVAQLLWSDDRELRSDRFAGLFGFLLTLK